MTIWPVWLNGWVFVCKLSCFGFESRCSYLIFRYRDCFEQGVPWHSSNYRVWIHSETRTWNDKNIQSYNTSSKHGISSIQCCITSYGHGCSKKNYVKSYPLNLFSKEAGKENFLLIQNNLKPITELSFSISPYIKHQISFAKLKNIPQLQTKHDFLRVEQSGPTNQKIGNIIIFKSNILKLSLLS